MPATKTAVEPGLTLPESRCPAEDLFLSRHLGPSPEEQGEMLRFLGYPNLEALIEAVVPASIRLKKDLSLPQALSEAEALKRLRELAGKNKIFRSYIGMGYSNCVTPPVIQRNILENPGWYTAYTPYQAEISQGRLEALLNFQTMVMDLTGLAVANASLLDEGTAAAEAMSLARAAAQGSSKLFFAAEDCHPQTLEVVRTRARALGLEVCVGDPAAFDFSRKPFGVLLQYPATDGRIRDYSALCAKAREAGALAIVAADLLSLTLLKSPGELGADIAVGSAQRFGVPLGYGGPHAAYFAVKDAYKRQMPGRVVGVSKDSAGSPALRLALQTREQHIRREKATSNICTAQVLLAVTASMYAVYHGPRGLERIARRVHALAVLLAEGLRRLGHRVGEEPFFDTVAVRLADEPARKILKVALERGINLRVLPGAVTIALDETVSERDVRELWGVFSLGKPVPFAPEDLMPALPEVIPAGLKRSTPYLAHPVFNSYRSETEMLRYLKRLEAKDLSLTASMIPLGSCTMKLNAASEMLPITWPELNQLHPFAPADQAQGYRALFKDLESWLAEITGFAAVSLQPNAGSQGEYAGLLVISRYHEARGESRRKVCLIPQSAHGTNPASAAMAGFAIVPVATSPQGDIDLSDLKAKAREHAADLAALMVTYPSTFGVFEEGIKDICEVVHSHGGLVYMDGANMNAQVGLCRPGDIGADVCHLNLHKTFCIPHGGGGPGMGPIAVAKHLSEYLPRHPAAPVGGAQGIGPVSAAPWGSASILSISWSYIAQMGPEGLRRASEIAILNANYAAKRLSSAYPVLFKGRSGLVAHECILDLRAFKASADIQVEDVAKRLMDYGFHAPTVSWPISGTFMVEPTESESKGELDRFCEALLSIRREIAEVEEGKADRADNCLKNSPHTALEAVGDSWRHPYSREKAVCPAPWTRQRKFWPPVGRIDGAYGDRNFICSCNSVTVT
ncbi:MAG: aminomethyl-transferring glycine dehydrogenase [Elusimicrobia bacterium]|nr:aminomethyl-transferring glycine dehydrogenase [Elusimicrobiota bacterium]